MKVKKLLKKLFRWLLGKSYGNTYRFLDELPAKNWFKYFETKELKWFIKNGKPTDEELAKAFENLYNDYIVKFGLDENYISHFNQLKKIQILKIKYALKKEGHIAMHLKIALKKFEEGRGIEEEPKSYLSLVAMVEKGLNRNINEDTISTEKFYNYLNQLKG